MNDFTFIGRVENVAQKTAEISQRIIVELTLVVLNPVQERSMFVNLQATEEMALQVSNLCNVGDMVMVKGNILTQGLDPQNLKIYFYITELHSLSRNIPREISDDELINTLRLFFPSYEPYVRPIGVKPTPTKKTRKKKEKKDV